LAIDAIEPRVNEVFARKHENLAGVSVMRATGREFLACSAWMALPAVLAGQKPASGDVPWLRETHEPPGTFSAPPRPLAPLLTDDRGRPITTLPAWYKRRVQLQRMWREVLGSLEISRTRPPAVEVVEEDRLEDVLRQRVRYLTEPDVTTEAYILRPRDARAPRRGAIVFHSTVGESIRQPAGLSDLSEKHFGLSLARRGFVVFCPRNFLWPETTRMAAEEETRSFKTRHPRARGMAKMLFDGQVALESSRRGLTWIGGESAASATRLAQRKRSISRRLTNESKPQSAAKAESE
jgi:hypothetical protein